MVEELSEDDRQNVSALIADEKYKSLIKLENNLKAKWLQQVFHGKAMGEQELMKRGGVMILQMLQQSIVDYFNTAQMKVRDMGEQEKILNGFGW